MPTLKVATAPLDSECKAILTMFISQGWDKAGVTYETHRNVVPFGDFSYLLKHSLLDFPTQHGSVFRPVLNSYATSKFGPDVGKIVFSLNADLA